MPNSEVEQKEIVAQMNEPRPLPMGRQEYEEWSDRIISGALIPSEPGEEEALREGMKFSLANMVMHLGPTESHKPDAFFIHTLRKVINNQVANTVMNEIKWKQRARLVDKMEPGELTDMAKEAVDNLNDAFWTKYEMAKRPWP